MQNRRTSDPATASSVPVGIAPADASPSVATDASPPDTTHSRAAPAPAPTPGEAPAPARTGSDFSALSAKIAEAGLLRRCPTYYGVRIGMVAGAYVGAWVAFALLGNTWWQLATAAVLGVVYAQVALVAHDIAHRQVFRRRRTSDAAGRLAGNLGIGMSYDWWQNKHTRHHANPNHEDLDPDVSPDILVWSKQQAGAASGLPRFLGGRQAYLFFPLLTLEGMNLHVASARAILRPSHRGRVAEAALLVGHIAVYLTALFLVLSPGKALVFLAVHQGLWGIYLGCTFAPNHKGMPTVTSDGDGDGEQKWDFLRKQVLTSRNVHGGRLVDLALGGLNHQIEHHLFPSMPTPHLRRARPIVKAHCELLGITYTETGLIASYAQTLRHLHDVGAPLRRPARA